MYNLPSTTEISGGLTTVGIGTPVYLEAEVNSAIRRLEHCQRHLGLTNKPGVFDGDLHQQPAGNECAHL